MTIRGNLCICVPSKGRPEVFYKKTFQILQHTEVPWFVFVEPQDYEEYLKYIPTGNVIILDKDDQGMSYVLSCIKLFCMELRYEFCFKMDDDVNHWYANSRVSPKIAQGGFLDDIQEDILGSAWEEHGDSLGGLSFPGKFFHGDWRTFTHINKMFEGLYVIRARDWYIPEGLRGNHEEFVASAHLVNEGKLILRVGRYCWSANMSTLAGGFQSFDREEEQRKDFEELEKLCPHLMKYTRKREYVQKDGRVFVVTDKSFFNRKNSTKIK